MIRILTVAQSELDEAIAYYNAQRDGLGDEFLDEILAALDRIVAFPEAWQEVGVSLRRCMLDRFPYGLIYHLESAGVTIIAVAHLHREPQYWRGRL